jgi:O-antigen ligase
MSVATPSRPWLPASPGWRASTAHARQLQVPRFVLGAGAASLVFLPMLRPSGPGNSSPVDVLIGLTIVATLVWALQSRLPLHLPYAIPAGILFAAGAIAGLAGPFPDLSLLQLFQDLVLLAWCAALVNMARRPAAFRFLLRAWSLGAILWAALLIFAYATGNEALSGVTDREGPRASLLAGDPNLLATYFVLSIMVYAATGWPSRRGLRAAGFGVLLGALGLTFSNGGMLALLVAAVVSLVIWSARRFGLVPTTVPVAALCLLLGAAVLTNLNIQELARTSGQPFLQNSLGRSDQSTAERATIIQEAVVLFNDGGPLGWGPRATKSVLAARQAPYAKEAHDDYIAAIVERGLLGGVGLLALIAAVAVRVPVLLRRPQGLALRAPIRHTAPIVGVIIGLAVFATNEQVLHFRQVWALFAVIAAYHLWATDPLPHLPLRPGKP